MSILDIDCRRSVLKMARTRVYAKVTLSPKERDYLQILDLCKSRALQVPSGVVQELENIFGRKNLSGAYTYTDDYGDDYAFFLIADIPVPTNGFDIDISELSIDRVCGIRIVTSEWSNI